MVSLKYATRRVLPAGSHANAPTMSSKSNRWGQELYEPLWEEIHARSKEAGFRIRSIWMADVAWEGQSSVLNEDSLGNDRE
jgi:hypothetical protein